MILALSRMYHKHAHIEGFKLAIPCLCRRGDAVIAEVAIQEVTDGPQNHCICVEVDHGVIHRHAPEAQLGELVHVAIRSAATFLQGGYTVDNAPLPSDFMQTTPRTVTERLGREFHDHHVEWRCRVLAQRVSELERRKHVVFVVREHGPHGLFVHG